MVIVFIFIIGLIGSSGDTCPQCNPITKEIIKEVPSNQDEINKLKEEINIKTQIMELDNKAILKSADIIELFSKSVIHIYNRDEYAIKKATKQMDNIYIDINELVKEKTNLSLQLILLETNENK